MLYLRCRFLVIFLNWIEHFIGEWTFYCWLWVLYLIWRRLATATLRWCWKNIPIWCPRGGTTADVGDRARNITRHVSEAAIRIIITPPIPNAVTMRSNETPAERGKKTLQLQSIAYILHKPENTKMSPQIAHTTILHWHGDESFRAKITTYVNKISARPQYLLIQR